MPVSLSAHNAGFLDRRRFSLHSAPLLYLRTVLIKLRSLTLWVNTTVYSGRIPLPGCGYRISTAPRYQARS